MAQQLHAKGHGVSLLALFNSFPPNSNFERLRCTPRCLGRFALNTARWLNYFRKWTPEQRRDFLRRKLILVRKGLQFRREGRAHTVEDIHAEDFIDVSEYADYQRHLWDIHLRASARYVPRPYAGHITVFRTRIHPFLCSFDPAFGWSQFAEGGCTVKVMTGAHESILDKPNVRALAEELDKCLLSAQALSQGPK
jgi:thioesterase domain-containing protein